MKKFLALLLALVMVLALAACGNTAAKTDDAATTDDAAGTTDAAATEDAATEVKYDVDKVSILFNSTFSETETGGVLVQYFADYLSDITGGAITTTIKPSGTLFDSADQLAAVSEGSIQMCALGHNPHSAELPLLCAFPDFAPDSVQNALDYFNYIMNEDPDSSAAIKAEADANNIVYLNVVAGGANAFIANYEFTDLTSFIASSTKFGNMEAPKFNYLGIKNVVEMLPFDIYDSFDKGLVDSTQMAFSSMVSQADYEVAEYWMLDNTYTAGNFFTANKDWWEGLTEDQQAAISEAAKATEEYSVQMYTDAIETDKQTLIDNGCTIVEMADGEFDTWWDAVFVSAVDTAKNRAEANGNMDETMAVLNAAATFTGYSLEG